MSIGLSDKSERQKVLQTLLARLPAAHRSTLRALFCHLAKVASRSDVNKMQPNNLGIVFGPVCGYQFFYCCPQCYPVFLFYRFFSNFYLLVILFLFCASKTLLRQSDPSLESIVMDTPLQSMLVEELLKNVEVYFPRGS